MKQIKTIYNRSANAFDEEVNQALKDGWTLTRRTFDSEGFLAELEKEVKPEKVSPVEMEEDEERGCWNCRYSHRKVNVTPCCDCTNAFAHGLNRWEAED